LTEQEGVDIEETALRYIAKAADGSMRDALSLLDQCIAFHYNETLTYEKVLSVLGAVDTGVFATLLEAVIDKNITGAVSLLDEIVMQGRELTQFVTDFTWYLRNLMLAKTTDSSADALEVSREAFERLQQEAGKLELNTILRYIRVFSELSGNLRYAVQKRIMIEVAIIKLCKPQMETTNDAVLDRIREIERQLEGGVVYQAPVGVSQGAVSSGVQVKPRPQLPKAIPEEIQRIVQNWNPILDAVGQPLKSYLNGVRLSLGGENVLLIVTEDFIAEETLKNPENIEILKRELDDFTGKDVNIRVEKVEQGDYFEDSYVDLFKTLGMPVEYSDMETE